MRVRTPRGLMVYSVDSETVLYDPTQNRRWTTAGLLRPPIVALLGLCASWTSEDQVMAWMKTLLTIDEPVARTLLVSMLGVGLLVGEEDEANRYVDHGAGAWGRHGWLAPLQFHAHTNLLPRYDYSTQKDRLADVEMMRDYVASEPQPPLHKTYPSADVVPLARNDGEGTLPFPSAVSTSVGYTQERRLDRAELGRFTYLAFGQTRWRRMAVSGEHVAKTSPSGGARHPTEVYPIVLDVEGLEPGAYHYNVRDHTLELLSLGDHTAFLMDHVFYRGSSTRWPRPAVCFLFTTIFERSQFRYRDSRSYRVMHFDIGHLTQTTRFLARAMRRCARPDFTLSERRVDAFLGIDGLMEASMAHVSLT